MVINVFYLSGNAQYTVLETTKAGQWVVEVELDENDSENDVMLF